MHTTSLSLLDRLRDDDQSSWRKLTELYTPLIRNWLARGGAPPQEIEDLTQNVMAVVVRRVPEFQRGERTGSFRRWLRTIAVNVLSEFWKSRQRRTQSPGGSEFQHVLDELADPNSGLSRQWDEEHDQHVTRRLLDWIRPQFQDKTWRAFQLVAVAGESPDEVARDLGLTVNAVFIAKSRVLAKLREEGKGLIE